MKHAIEIKTDENVEINAYRYDFHSSLKSPMKDTCLNIYLSVLVREEMGSRFLLPLNIFWLVFALFLIIKMPIYYSHVQCIT